MRYYLSSGWLKSSLALVSLFTLAMTGQPSNAAGNPPAVANPPSANTPTAANNPPVANSTTGTASTKLGLDLLRQKANSPTNVFISPLSINAGMQLAYGGAAGKTIELMNRFLYFDGKDASTIAKDYQSFVQSLGIPQVVDKQEDVYFFNRHGHHDRWAEVELANSAWGNSKVVFKPSFINLLNTSYQAECKTLNFKDPSSKTQINNWVSNKTKGKIGALVEELKADDLLLLVNAAYFKAHWEKEFRERGTKPAPFYLTDSKTKNVQMMMMHDHLKYSETPEFQAVRLAFTDGRYSMYVFLPAKTSSLSQFMSKLTYDQWLKLIDSKQNAKDWNWRDSYLSMPRFKMSYQTKLKDALSELGLKELFTPSANFSAMISNPSQAAISDVIHKAFIDVNERGIEATAATAVEMVAGGGVSRAEPFEMVIDRPFFFAIVFEDKDILFAGTQVDPES